MNVSTDFKPVLTRAAVALQQAKKNSEFTALVFQESQPGASTNKPKAVAGNEDKAIRNTYTKPDDTEFDMKKARNEVLQFAINNQRVIKNKRKMEIFHLIQLGCKPPKKEYKNYKDLKEERGRLKKIREERKKFHQLGKNQAGAASVKCRSKTKIEHTQKKRAPVANIDQHYGKPQPKFKKRK